MTTQEHSVRVEILKEIPDVICEKDLFFVSGSRLDRRLSEQLRKMTTSGLEIGKDVGLTTLSTDFFQMGRTAAQMILSGKVSKAHCPCSLIRRNTF